jgi:hypothetical protein
MKKLLFFFLAFTSLTAFAGQMAVPSHTSSTFKSANQFASQTSSNLRSTCDTLSNLTLADSNAVYFIDTVGYLSGNGAIYGGAFLDNLSIAEKFDAPASSGYAVSAASVFFAFATINPTHGDSAKLVKAYVYDTTGTNGIPGYSPGYSPGNAIDSASVTLGSIAAAVAQVNASGFLVPTVFTFNNVNLTHGAGFFIAVALPQTTGDTIVIFTNNGNTNNGKGWVDLAGAGWLAYDSLFGVQVGNFVVPVVCGAAASCPTIAVSATQSGATGTASASGGVSPYTYAWSNNATTATASNLVNGTTYHVTATDANGCTGVGTLTIAGITAIEAGVTNFSVFPNPSNGVFTASISLETASDVTISIVDMTGNKIYESTDKAVKDLNKSINLSTAATGVYFVSVKTDKGTANQRIVLQ